MKKIPDISIIASYLERIDYSDTYKIKTTRRESPEEAAQEIFSNFPGWINALLALRNKIVRLFGLKTEAESGAKTFFNSYYAGEKESILGIDDKHLDCRVSTLLEDDAQGSRTIYMTTAVQYNNKLGVIYFTLIKPFHKIIVKSCLKHYAKNEKI